MYDSFWRTNIILSKADANFLNKEIQLEIFYISFYIDKLLLLIDSKFKYCTRPIIIIDYYWFETALN